jgi:hypothetical protein
VRAGEAARPSPLHVTNGESAGHTLQQTGLGGAVLPWQDVLHEGPVPAGSRQALLRTRAAFLSACGWGSSQAILSSLERRDGRLLQALRDRQQVVLWFEHDLYDQLQLLDILALASAADRPPELIVIGSFPGEPSFRGLGELTADQLERRAAPGCPAAERRRRLRRAVAQADASRRTGTRPERRPRKAPGPRPVGRRNAPHRRHGVAVGPS